MSLSTFKLANGHTIPAVAYGTGTKWFKYGNDELDTNLVATLKLALGKGFTHIDGAEVYNTDKEVGAAIAGVDRQSVYITNKHWVSADPKMQLKHKLPYAALKAQLQLLGTDYVDLYLLHSPFVPEGTTLGQLWREMERAVDDGLAKSIGVSNFGVAPLEEILKEARIRPVANQIEFSALLQNQTPGIYDFAQKENILLEAYAPLGPLKTDAGKLTLYVEELAAKYSKTLAQILLRWVLQRGVLPVTTSSNEERIAQFNDIFNFDLSLDEVAAITKLGLEAPAYRQYFKEEYAKYD